MRKVQVQPQRYHRARDEVECSNDERSGRVLHERSDEATQIDERIRLRCKLVEFSGWSLSEALRCAT